MFGFIYRFRILLTILFLFGAALSLLLIKSTFNGGFGYSIKILAVPAAVFMFGFTYAYRRQLSSHYPNRTWVMWLIAAMSYPMVLLFGWQYVMMINAMLADGQPFAVDGRVTRKFRTGKGNNFVFTVKDVGSGQPIDVEVSGEEYNDIETGSNYRACFQKGFLGIPFNWRYRANSNVCEKN